MAAWDRMEGETDEALQAFRAYRDQGMGNRSAREVAQELGKSYALINRWCSKWEWVRRASEWDAHAQARQDEAHLEAIKEAKKAEHENATAIGNRVVEALLAKDFNLMSAEQLTFLWNAATKHNWMALGLDSKAGKDKGAGEVPIAKLYGDGVDVDKV